MITNAMSELHPQTLAEQIRSLGNACSCSYCRGRDAEIDAVIAEHDADQQAEIEKLQTLAYLGEHHFPDQTWKARCQELRAEIERLTAALAGELRNELTLASAYCANATIKHCEDRLDELKAAEAAGGKE